MSEMAQIFEKHADVLGAIRAVQAFLDDAYLSGEETCTPDDWKMGCAGCQARMISLQLDMVAREVEDDMARLPLPPQENE
jgi:hypothetical protein